MSEAHKDRKYKSISEIGKNNIRKAITGRKLSEETKKKMSLAKSGANNHNWKGGISKNAHSPKEPKYRQWRSAVFERDNWTCQTCGVRGCYLEAHHIKGWAKHPELRYDLDNGVALCKECHKLTDNYKGKK